MWIAAVARAGNRPYNPDNLQPSKRLVASRFLWSPPRDKPTGIWTFYSILACFKKQKCLANSINRIYDKISPSSIKI